MERIECLEDLLTAEGFDDKTIVLVVASYLGGQAILGSRDLINRSQSIKEDGSTVGELDILSGRAIAEYVNSSALDSVQFRSEENMGFNEVENPEFAGIFDDLDGSINPLVGGTNLQYIGVGGVIHQKDDDEQIAAAAYLPFADESSLFFAQKGKGTYRVNLDREITLKKIELSTTPSPKNIIIESGFMTPSTLQAEQALYEGGFYGELGLTTRDRVTGGIFQTVSGIKDSRQVVLNIASSHQADYCYLLLSEAGADVIGQNGDAMYSTSYAMLSIAPSYTGDKEVLKQKFVEALKDYEGWSPGKVVLEKVAE